MDSPGTSPPKALDWAKRGFERLQASSPADAAEAFRRAIELQDDVDLFHFGLGEALKRQDRHVESERAFRRALDLNPEFADGQIALGFLQLSRGAPRAALGELERAVILRPNMARAWLGLAIARLAVGAIAEAEAAAQRALAIEPDDVEALTLRAIAEALQGRAQQAEASFARALAPGRAAIGRIEELAASLHNLGRPREALIAFRRLAEIEDWARRSMHKLFETSLDFPESDFGAWQAERRRWGALMTKGTTVQLHDNLPEPERRLRLGFVGAVFCANSSRHVIMPALRAHDRQRYEIWLYSNTKREDDVTVEYRRLADRWRVIRALDQRAAARMIRDDGIDILIDLNGISEDHRLDVFALKPAPVQISAWGYPSGTGLPTVDALFTDRWSVKAEEARHFAEQIVYLPCWTLFDPSDVPAAGPQPVSSSSLFGSLTRVRKVTAESYDLWAALLARVPGSRMLIKDFALDDPLIAKRVADEFLDRGIGPTRIELLGASNRTDHLRHLARIDVALSPFPHAGGVTTLEALAMGVPVVALNGRTVPERNSSAILNAIGRDAWIAETPQDYIEIAARLAEDRGALKALRDELPRDIAKSAIGDPIRYFASVDAAYRKLWRAWCAPRRQASIGM